MSESPQEVVNSIITDAGFAARRRGFGWHLAATALSIGAAIGAGAGVASAETSQDVIPSIKPDGQLAEAVAASSMIRSESSTCFALPGDVKPGDAAILNVVVTGALADGYTAARASDTTQVYRLPASQQYSTGNFKGSRYTALQTTDPNMALTETGDYNGTGKAGVCIDLKAGLRPGQAAGHLIVDYIGYSAHGSPLVTTKPTRLTDTRGRNPLVSDVVLDVKTAAIPNGSKAWLNVIAPSSGVGYVETIGAGDTPNHLRPNGQQTSVVNLAQSGKANPNTSFAEVGNGRVGVEIHTARPGGRANVIVDQFGYIEPEGLRDNVETQRIYDSRSGDAAVPSGGRVCMNATKIDSDISAGDSVIINQTVPYTTAQGWVNVYPSNARPPFGSTSTANFKPFFGQYEVDPNTVVVQTSPKTGEFCFDARSADGRNVPLVVDLQGVLKKGVILAPGNGTTRLVDSRIGKFPTDPTRPPKDYPYIAESDRPGIDYVKAVPDGNVDKLYAYLEQQCWRYIPANSKSIINATARKAVADGSTVTSFASLDDWDNDGVVTPLRKITGEYRQPQMVCSFDAKGTEIYHFKY